MLNEVLAEVRGGKPGEFLNRDNVWQIGYDFLCEFNNIAKATKGAVPTETLKERAYIFLLSQEVCRLTMRDACKRALRAGPLKIEDFTMRIGRGIIESNDVFAKLLSTVMPDGDRLYTDVKREFVKKIIDEGVEVDDAIKGSVLQERDLDYLLDFATPDIAVETISIRGVTNLGIARVSANPITQIIKSIRGFREVRRRAPGNKVVAQSWLITEKNKRLLEAVGFTEDRGVKYSFDNRKRLLRALGILSSGEYRGRTRTLEYMRAKFHSINYSPKNVERFLRDGELPDIGKITIPSEVFYLGQ